VVLNIFGAKPPKFFLGNCTRDYLKAQQPTFNVLPNYRAIDQPETISADGVEMLLRGFADIASSGRYIQGSDYTARGCNASLVKADGSAGACFGRTPVNVGFVLDRLFWYVDASNPVKDLTKDQLSKAVTAILAKQPLTWSQLYPGVTFPSSLANAPVNILNGPPGGGIPQSIQDTTGVPTNSITALPSATISAITKNSTNWLTYGLLSSPPSIPNNRLTWNGVDVFGEPWPMSHTFNAITDTSSDKWPAIQHFLCFVLNWKFVGSDYGLFPLSDDLLASEKKKIGC